MNQPGHPFLTRATLVAQGEDTTVQSTEGF